MSQLDYDIWTPDPDAPGAEGLLGQALVRSRSDSLDFLGVLLPGLDLGVESQRTDGGTVHLGQQPFMNGWIDPHALLDRILADQDLGGGRVRLVRDGFTAETASIVEEARPGSVVRTAVGRLAWALDEGFTVVVNGIDRRDRTLRRLSEMFGRAFGSLANINAYISLREHPSFGPHWDDHEVIIMQLIGTKSWKLLTPTDLSPTLPLHAQRSEGSQIWDGVIEPGHFLYIHRGWGHDVLGTEELSLHLTISIPRLRTNDVIAAAMRQRTQDPRSTTIEALDDDGATGPWTEEFDEFMQAALAPERVNIALGRYRGYMLPSNTQLSTKLARMLISGSVPADAHIRCPHPGGVMPARSSDGTMHLAFSRQVAHFDESEIMALAPALDGRVHHVQAILDRAGGASTLVERALRSGLIELSPAEIWGGVPSGLAGGLLEELGERPHDSPAG